jgi:nicotinate-nucleotide pyrophosphorylase (carboxylating)
VSDHPASPHHHAQPSLELDPPSRDAAARLIDLALAEDLADSGDITTRAVVPPEIRGGGSIVARQAGVLAGRAVVDLLVQKLQLGDSYHPRAGDGDRLAPGQIIARLEGPLAPILVFERTALNFLGHLSGIASATARFVAAVAGTRAQILDTRKTLPGWRLLEKFAVRCGGGVNHRIGLYDGVLIKDNHLAAIASLAADPIAEAVARARANTPAGTVIEIEVDSLSALERALHAQPAIILIDNFSLEDLAQAVRLRDQLAPRVRLEASGGVSLETVAAIAATGVDRISVGAITHSAPNLDIALDFDSPAASHAAV